MRKHILLLAGLFSLACSVIYGQDSAPPTVEETDPLSVEFDIPGGFYDDSLVLRLFAPEATIYYTTDGNTPRVSSEYEYDGPIPIDFSTVIRAIAVKEGEKTLPISHTYFINEPTTTFPVVSLAIPPDDLFHPIRGMFVRGNDAVDTIWSLPGANFWTRSEIPINTEIFESDGTCFFRSGSGFRLFGGMSRLFPQKSMTIVTRHRYGDNRVRHRVFGEEGKKKFKFLVLRNSGSDFGKAHFRDAFMTSLVEDMDIETQDYRPAHVYINGAY